MKPVQKLKNLRGKRVLVRVDFNVESEEDALRLTKSLPTIQYLRKQGAIVLLVSHRGKPKGKVVPELSLRFAARFLKRHIAATVFLSGSDIMAHQKKIATAKNGTVFLFENIRFLKEEEACNPAFAKKLAGYADYYVNDAFAVSHRKGASLTLLPKLLPAYAGILLQEEIAQLSRLMKKPKHPFVVILAGGKASDKFSVIEKLYDVADQFLIGGVLANTFFAAQGMPVDGSVVDKDLLDKVGDYFNDEKISLPLDWLSDENGKIVDIGEMTRGYYRAAIEDAKTVVWSGPLGIFEEARSREGSASIARAVAENKEIGRAHV